jgi:hypothetical protein
MYIKSWTDMRDVWRRCDDLFKYLNDGCFNKSHLNNKHLYEAYDLFTDHTKFGL